MSYKEHPVIDLPSEALLPSPLLVVEDEPMMQVRLRSILRGLGYAQEELFFAGSIAQAKTLLVDQPFAMTLVDVGLPDGNGIDLIGSLHEHDAALPILVISAWSNENTILEALRAGATGYLLKERDDVELSLSIRSTIRGGAPIDPFIARRILELVSAPAPSGRARPSTDRPGRGKPALAAPPLLTPREVEILNLVAKGLTNREISGVLSLSRFTVECHIRNIYKKLSVKSRTEAIFEARSQGFLP
ncbi:response regulator transcription factor [Mesorhizobium sp. M7A.F.Ca.CA.001.07.2.1]|uniref:LuxR C-terminal-related transcriptional regulator n=3 Tax=Phyllobacteriaceae TaxID=69277 RepID=UPI000FCA21DA|nr:MULTISPECIES: response regulator transcription factor [Mesorhizobium]RVB30855.1 response regulator transcription factor [Mesorhizobium sp. M7A.F.Ca.CA.004.05.1.1]MCF6123052.1 response regulator transcription factor [Mesorhizobium ciceri]MCQ8816914.1 response regulator transcription factor [Mesorhizobium sp. SEMIA396]RUX73416.1 response regulator transcription factor [Mesorhizobium sp. M7A.F.Ca.CA.004.08.2.1]RUX80303.1 response regulator transcription factor [Mesorhizobium sp. M7A.F.Ca.CA.00